MRRIMVLSRAPMTWVSNGTPVAMQDTRIHFFSIFKEVMMKRYLSLFVGCCIVFGLSTMAHAEQRKVSDTSAGCPCAGDKNTTETGSVGTAISVPVPLGLGPLVSLKFLRDTSSKQSGNVIDGMSLDFILPVLSDLPFGVSDGLSRIKGKLLKDYGCWVRKTQENEGVVVEMWTFKRPCPYSVITLP